MPRGGPLVHRMTQSKLQERRQRGLCFYYDDPYVPGNRCKQSQILMIKIEGEDMGLDEKVPDECFLAKEEWLNFKEDVPVQLHAIVDKQRSKGHAMKLMRQVHGVAILVFINSGAYRSFLNPTFAEQLDQHIDTQSIENVAVASGKSFSTKSMIR